MNDVVHLTELEKELFELAEKSGGCLELDLSDDNQYDYFISKMSAENYRNIPMPNFLKLAEKERKIAMGKKADGLFSNSKKKTGYVDGVYIEQLTFVNSSVKAERNNAYSAANANTGVARINCKFKEPKAGIRLDYSMFDENDVIFLSGSKSYDSVKNVGHEIKGDFSRFSKNTCHKYGITALVTELYQANDSARLKAKIATNSTVVLPAEEPVKSVVLDAPVIKEINKSKHSNVFVSYLRDGHIPDFDYSYENAPFPANETDINKKKIKFILDVALTLKVNDGHEIKGLDKDFGYRLFFSHPDGGVVQKYEYNTEEMEGVSVILIPDSNLKNTTAQIIMPKDWGTALPFINLVDKTNANLDIYGQFTFTIERADNKSKVPITISFKSNSESPADINNIISDKIYFQWGCMDENTLIQLSSGMLTYIKDVKIGDLVLNAEGGFSKVVNIYTGKDNIITSITTESGKSILVSYDHPLLSEKGWISAQDLNVCDKIKCISGYEKITDIHIEKYNGTVYDLAFENKTPFIGNGIFVGDFEMQQTIRPKPKSKSTEVVVSDELIAVIEELKSVKHI